MSLSIVQFPHPGSEPKIKKNENKDALGRDFT